MGHVTSEQLLTPLRPWLDDPGVTEIMMNKPGEVYIEKGGCIFRHTLLGFHVLHVMRALQLIANENEKIFNAQAPLLSGKLYDQSRIQAVLPPISRSVCFSIRKHSEQRRTWESLMTPAYFSLSQDSSVEKSDSLQLLLEKADWPSFLRAALLAKKTLLISGETGSGKTTLLSVLLSAIRKDERVIVLEDTPELPISRYNSLSLLARDDDFLAKPIDLAQLLRTSLRLRPDRLVLGELRSHEAYDFISACQTGHGGSMATIHAGSPCRALERLTQLFLLRSGSAFPLTLLRELVSNVIDIVIQLSRRSGRPSVIAIYYRGEVYD